MFDRVVEPDVYGRVGALALRGQQEPSDLKQPQARGNRHSIPYRLSMASVNTAGIEPHTCQVATQTSA